MEKFIEIFKGLNRAHGCTYINTVPKNGVKLKTKSFKAYLKVQRERQLSRGGIHRDPRLWKKQE